MLIIPVRIKNTEHLTPDEEERLLDELHNNLSDAVFQSLIAAKLPKPPGTPDYAGGFGWSIQTWDVKAK